MLVAHAGGLRVRMTAGGRCPCRVISLGLGRRQAGRLWLHLFLAPLWSRRDVLQMGTATMMSQQLDLSWWGQERHFLQWLSRGVGLGEQPSGV